MKSPIWLLCGIVLCFLGGFAVGDTDAHLEKDILDLVNEIQAEHLQTGAEHQQTGEKIKRLKALAEKLNVPQPEPDPCPDCPDCPDCDDDDPDPPPPPPVDGVYPLTINGQPWTFRTPPSALKVVDHPRFLLPGREDQIRAKLSDPEWKNTLRQLEGDPELNALQYALLGDVAAGQAAKAALLALDGKMDSNGDAFLDFVLVYDWCNDLLTASEKETALRLLLGECGLTMPEPGSTEFGVTSPRHTEKGDGVRDNYGNDSQEPRTHAKGFQLRGMVPLAAYGDGVRDEFCAYGVEQLRINGDGRFYPIYDGVRGGPIDMHNSMALDSGGTQAGGHTNGTITGYNAMFFDSAPRLLAMWETATGDELFSRDNFYRKAAEWIVFRGEPVGSSRGLQDFLMLTGIYKDIDPQAAALSAWINQQHGDGSYYPIFALTLGDKSVEPKSPQQLGLPLSSFRAGDDRFFSRSSWSPDSTTLMLTTRTIDSNRYEPDVGLLSITSGREKLMVAGQAKKGGRCVLYGSGIWLWPTGQSPNHIQQSSTYWGGFHLPADEKVPRAENPYDVASLPGYRGVLPTEDHGNDSHHVFTIDASRFACDGDKSRLGVLKNKRTVVHLKPVDGREFVVVYDRVSVGDGVSQLWGCRLMNEPVVDGQSFTATVENKAIHGTFLTPVSLDVRGGPGKATEGPNGESHDGTGYDFKDDDSGRENFGSYALFAQGTGTYCVVLEIGDAGFVPAAATMTGNVVSVGGWLVDFTVEDKTKVSR